MMQDITGAKLVEVAIRDDGKVLWVNTEEGCVLRICRIDHLTAVDSRKPAKSTEETIQEIFSKADELRVLLKLPEEETRVRVDRWHSMWHVSVRPSLMTFGGKFTHLMDRGHHGKTLEPALAKALAGAIEELELFKEGKTMGV